MTTIIQTYEILYKVNRVLAAICCALTTIFVLDYSATMLSFYIILMNGFAGIGTNLKNELRSTITRAMISITAHSPSFSLISQSVLPQITNKFIK